MEGEVEVEVAERKAAEEGDGGGGGVEEERGARWEFIAAVEVATVERRANCIGRKG